MNVYAASNFPGLWPVPTAAVVVAPNGERAREVLRAACEARGLTVDRDWSCQLEAVCGAQYGVEGVVWQSDGNY